MTEAQKDRQSIPEFLADEPTRPMLAKARKQMRVSLVKKLKVSMETVRRSEKRIDLYRSTMREYAERNGGTVYLSVEFPNQPSVILAGLGENANGKKPKKKARPDTKSKPKSRRAV